MGLYASLGVAQAASTFAMGLALGWMAIYVSRNMHYAAVHKVFHAPMVFFDRTPLGRILGVFGKDIDSASLVTQLAVQLRGRLNV
jgi:ATP-binding cassette, subfamily C (CFTR/MRP), member 1